MAQVSLPHDAKAGPTKPEVRAVLLGKLDLAPTDHFTEVGSCTGAVTSEAVRRAGRVTALERKAQRLETTRRNLAANDLSGSVDLREADAPEGLPGDADVLFILPAIPNRRNSPPRGGEYRDERIAGSIIGGSRNYEAVLDHAVETGVDRIVMNVSRLEVAGAATTAFRERDLLDDVVQFQVSHGCEFAGATSVNSDNPVYMLVGGAGQVAADGGERISGSRTERRDATRDVRADDSHGQTTSGDCSDGRRR